VLENVIKYIWQYPQILTSGLLLVVSIFVLTNTRRKNRADIFQVTWSSQQQINYLAASNPKVAIAADALVTGFSDEFISDTDSDTDLDGIISISMYLTFIQLNRLHVIWKASHGSIINILRKSEALPTVNATLSITNGIPELLEYCLSSGYERKFVTFINKNIDSQRINRPKSRSSKIREIKDTLKNGVLGK